ncbi:MAG: T9SS type A sorting domain-containing protein [Bacteroidetes bacterium]|nr:T9SS type A sorting domain-containing protein [Bacteroidota bacterium]
MKLTTANANGCNTIDSVQVSVITTIADVSAGEIKLNVYPNPFKEFTNIGYTLVKNTNVSIEVFDVLGRKVSTLTNGVQPAGEYNFNFNNSESGIYIIKLIVDGVTINKEIISVN